MRIIRRLKSAFGLFDKYTKERIEVGVDTFMGVYGELMRLDGMDEGEKTHIVRGLVKKTITLTLKELAHDTNKRKRASK